MNNNTEENINPFELNGYVLDTINSCGIEGYTSSPLFYQALDKISSIKNLYNMSEKNIWAYYITIKEYYGNVSKHIPLHFQEIIKINQSVRKVDSNFSQIDIRNVNVRLVGIDVPLMYGDKLKIQYLLQLYCEYINEMLIELSFEDLLKLHVLFELIHPFEDGNGRTGRILLNMLYLLKFNTNQIIVWDYVTKYHGYYKGLQEAEKWIVDFIKINSWDIILNEWESFIEDYIRNTEVSILKETSIVVDLL